MLLTTSILPFFLEQLKYYGRLLNMPLFQLWDFSIIVRSQYTDIFYLYEDYIVFIKIKYICVCIHIKRTFSILLYLLVSA